MDIFRLAQMTNNTGQPLTFTPNNVGPNTPGMPAANDKRFQAMLTPTVGNAPTVGGPIRSQADYTASYGNPYNSSVSPITTTNIQMPGTGNLTSDTVADNLASGPTLESLSNLINQINLNAQQQANAGRIPNAPALESASSANIAAELAGQVPQDVVNLLAQKGAERGVGMGAPGSPNSNAAYLQALGLTSLQQQQLGQQNLTSALGRNPVAPIFDPSKMLLTPDQAGRLNLGQQQLALDWWNALHGQPTSGRGRGGGGETTGQPTTGGGVDWFPRMGGTPSTGGIRPAPIPYDYSTDAYGNPVNPETGEPLWTDVYGGFNPENPSDWNFTTPGGTSGYGPYSGGAPYGGDASSLGYWDFTNPSNFDTTTYDPFGFYEGGNPEWGD